MVVKITGNKAVVTSEITKEQYDEVKALRPDALEVKNDKDEPIFKVGMGEKSSINKYGVTFDGVAIGEDHKLCFTVDVKASEADAAKTEVANVVMAFAANLDIVEQQVERAYDSIAEIRLDTMRNIELV